jgi:uncharacterized RDD family membrane protein YckC
MTSSQAVPGTVSQPAFAGLDRRLAAYLLDAVIAASVLLFSGFTMRGLRAFGLWLPAVQGLSPTEMWRGLGVGAKLSILFGFVLSMGPVYSALFEASPWQASFGKRLLDIYVSDDEGRRIGIARAFGRWFAKFFFNWFALWVVSMVTIAATREKKALHDFVARTLVLRGRPVPGGSLEPWRITFGFGIPFLLLLGIYLTVL